jgi:hypothetical protein
MALIDYPSSLPGILISNIEVAETPHYESNQVQSGTDVNEFKSDVTSLVVSASWSFSDDESVIFDDWFKDDLNLGVEPFNIDIPVGSGLVSHECRFSGRVSKSLNGKRKRYTAVLVASELIYQDECSALDLLKLMDMTCSKNQCEFFASFVKFGEVDLPDAWMTMPTYILDRSPLFYYRMQDDTSSLQFKDSSVNANNTQSIADYTLEEMPISSSNYSSKNLVITEKTQPVVSNPIDLRGDLTFHAIINPTNNAPGVGESRLLFTSGELNINPDQGQSVVSDYSIPINEATHIVIVRDNLNYLFYINGVLKYEAATSYPPVAPTANIISTIGGQAIGGSDFNRAYLGYATDIAVYDKALPASFARDIYSLGVK